LIRPEYDCGVHSQVRETLLLNALAREQEGNFLQLRAVLDTLLLPVMRPEYRQELLQSSQQMAFRGAALRELCGKRQLKQIQELDPTNKKTIAEMVAVLKTLKESDFSDRMANVLREAS
jgi:hypothetical protein